MKLEINCTLNLATCKDGHSMLLKDFKPRSTLVVPSTPIDLPRYPVIDAHNHLFGDWENLPTAQLLTMLDRCGVRGFVDLDGGWERISFTATWTN
jgi:hypothetical protein